MQREPDLLDGLAGRFWLLTLGIVHTGLMYVLLYGAIQKLPTSLTGALSFTHPVVAFLVAILLAAAGSMRGWGAGRRGVRVPSRT